MRPTDPGAHGSRHPVNGASRCSRSAVHLRPSSWTSREDGYQCKLWTWGGAAGCSASIMASKQMLLQGNLSQALKNKVKEQNMKKPEAKFV
ncbi:unnamed protein product [Caretta caretta]